ncbi:MAG: hypothetical protein ABJA70_07000 [Chryseolinea sp.]
MHQSIADVTTSHIFLGYKPLIIALPVLKTSEANGFLNSSDKVTLHFELNRGVSNDPDDKMIKSVATLELYKLETRSFDSHALLIYKGICGDHSFLSPWHKFVNHQREKIEKREPGNVGLPANLLDQVQIAYAVPRKISVITVGNNSIFNMFPTDLFGEINCTKYVSSLRVGGRATQQVEEIKNVVFSDVDISSFRKVYDMGKNHMRDLREATSFDLATSRSEKFGFILPESFTRYREMRLLESWEHGMHRIHFYDVINQVNSPGSTSELAHIHRLYAGWREKMGLKTDLYLR